MRRYKIIEDLDENGAKFYELWWHTPFLWMKDKWTVESEYMGHKVRRRIKFDSYGAVVHYINERYKPSKRTVVEEGVIE